MSDSAEYKAQEYFALTITKAAGDLVASQDFTANIFINPSFAVKKMKFYFAYRIGSDINCYYYVTSPVVDGGLIGTLSRYSHTEGPLLYMIDGIRQDTSTEYVFVQPKRFNGTIPLIFDCRTTGIIIDSISIQVIVEVLG